MFSRKFIISSFRFAQKTERIIESQDFRAGGDLGYHLDQFPYFTRKHVDYFFFFLASNQPIKNRFPPKGKELRHKAFPEEGRALWDSP